MEEFKLSVIVPVYNEEKTVIPLLERVADVALLKEVIVVDDGSTDRTRHVLQARPELYTRLVTCDENRGKGFAIRKGLEHVTGAAVLIQDADLEYDPAEYRDLVAPILQQGARVVYGSRIRKRNPKASWLFYLGGRSLSLVTNVLYGTRITDEPTCYKVVETALLRSFRLECDGFEFCPEVTAKIVRSGVPIIEVPISYRPRGITEGKKIRFRDALIAVWTLVKYRFWKP